MHKKYSRFKSKPFFNCLKCTVALPHYSANCILTSTKHNGCKKNELINAISTKAAWNWTYLIATEIRRRETAALHTKWPPDAPEEQPS